MKLTPYDKQITATTIRRTYTHTHERGKQQYNNRIFCIFYLRKVIQEIDMPQESDFHAQGLKLVLTIKEIEKMLMDNQPIHPSIHLLGTVVD